jgi:hypothetical protein
MRWKTPVALVAAVLACLGLLGSVAAGPSNYIKAHGSAAVQKLYFGHASQVGRLSAARWRRQAGAEKLVEMKI